MSDSARLLAQLSTSVVVVNAAGLIQFMNGASESLLGVSARRATGRSLYEHLPCVSEDLKPMIESAADRRLAFAQDLTLLARPSAPEDRVVDCRVSPYEGDEEDQVLVEFADITRRLRVHRENMLLQQHAASRRMVRQLAHEIKNPLGGIRGAAQLLQRQLAQPDQQQYTGVIVAEADRLAGLANTLLGPVSDSEKQETNIHDLLEHVARLTSADSKTAPTVVRDYDPGLPSLNLDRNQLIQAILNLVNNAVAASGPDGQIILRTQAVANFTIGSKCHRMIASVAIEDNGPGIAEDIRDSVFFPLVTGTEGGTGLGLPLSQELINRHDGLIEFESRPGKTVFYIRLPIL